MASDHDQFSSFFILLLLISSVLSTAVGETITTDHQITGRRDYVHKIVNAISDAGYLSMSLALDMTLNTLIAPPAEADQSVVDSRNTKFTIFCPPDEAFFSSLKYPQPPLTLLKYHIVPMKLDRESLEYSPSSSSSSSVARLPIHSKIDTLLPGHPLVLTSFTDQLGFSSINFINITKWELYNDGYVIVHGIENFFDPAYQTLLYPQYDKYNNIANHNKNNNSTSSSNNKSKSGVGNIKKYVTIMVCIWFVVFIVVITFLENGDSCLGRLERDDEYFQVVVRSMFNRTFSCFSFFFKEIY